MSTYDDKKNAKGRSWDQITKDGTGSAASVGVGGTGDSGKLTGDGSQQSAGRTDDLLDDGTSEEGARGFLAAAARSIPAWKAWASRAVPRGIASRESRAIRATASRASASVSPAA
jgi:hypothetical protein